ncbi:uncharacterized protein LOC125529699 [Triticum urartu]|nr:uncharacterized protein LOC125529699 [Triticum urartu]
MAPPLLLLLLLLIRAAGTSSAPAPPAYSAHCPAPPAVPDLPAGAGPASAAPAPALQLSTGYFSGGGDLLFGPDNGARLPRSFALLPTSVLPTADASVLRVAATLSFSGAGRNRNGIWPSGRNRRLFDYDGQQHRLRPRLPRFVGRRGSLVFDLHGYYSSASGDLCMVGWGSGRAADGRPVALLAAVLRLRFPHPANLSSPFVTGRLESTGPGPGAAFEPVSLLAYAEEGYAYAESASCPRPPADGRDVRQLFGGRNFTCPGLRSLLKPGFRLDYGNGGQSAASSLGINQTHMFVNRVHCAADGAVRVYVAFSNMSDYSRYYFMVTEKAIVAEGFWDQNSNRLCLKGCHVVNSGSSRAELTVSECGIGMTFWFPGVWSIQERSFSAGLVWNTSLKSDQGIAGYSTAVRGNFGGLKYNYTKVEEATKYYKQYGLNKKRKGKFPDRNSYLDLAFRFNLQKRGGSGYASPITIGTMLSDGSSFVLSNLSTRPAVLETKQRLLNVSYNIRYVGHWSLATFQPQQISAEGVYDTETGSLCLIACRRVNVSSSDCKILITAHFASLDAKAAKHVQGKIISLRGKTDPLFFETLDIDSYGMYIGQVEESIWRMDLESTMALISMTLSCAFIAVQLFHVKKVPEALPAMSITMLVVLALGYMTPLVLNFEALFKHSNKQTVPFSGGGWLEVNEVMVRIITMATFLLQLRLLQLAWSARSSVDGSKHEAWAAERKVLWVCLPLYIIGGVITAIVHMRTNHSRRMLRQVARLMPSRHTFWEDIVPYGGLLLDGFLLPQVILNVFSASKVRALSPVFYIGGTMLRALPHAYDAYRTHHFVRSMRPSYIYASSRDDLFSLAWDIVIPCGVVLLATLLFFQQWLGGAFFVCSKRRKPSNEYEMVSTVSS